MIYSWGKEFLFSEEAKKARQGNGQRNTEGKLNTDLKEKNFKQNLR
jgi:hypothetical protein